MKLLSSKEGSVPLLVLIVVLVLMIVGGGFYYLSKKEMIVKGCAKDARTKNVISNPKITFSCEGGSSKTCDSFSDGSFVCRAEVKEGGHCGVHVGFKTASSGRIEDTSLVRYITGEPGKAVEIEDMLVPIENEEDQKSMVETYNLFGKYLEAFAREDWNQIKGLGIDCGLDKTLVSKYNLRWFIQNSFGQKDGVYLYGVTLKDCEKGCDIQKNKMLSYELHLQRNPTSNQWNCWHKTR